MTEKEDQLVYCTVIISTIAVIITSLLGSYIYTNPYDDKIPSADYIITHEKMYKQLKKDFNDYTIIKNSFTKWQNIIYSTSCIVILFVSSLLFYISYRQIYGYKKE